MIAAVLAGRLIAGAVLLLLACCLVWAIWTVSADDPPIDDGEDGC